MVTAEVLGHNKATGKYEVKVTSSDKKNHVVREFDEHLKADEFAYNVNNGITPLKEDAVQLSGKEAKTKKKHPFKAIASAVCPGLGQVFDGRWKDGIKYAAVTAGIGIAAKANSIFGASGFARMVETGSKAGKIGYYASLAAGVALAVGMATNYIKGIADAYRGGKKA